VTRLVPWLVLIIAIVVAPLLVLAGAGVLLLFGLVWVAAGVVAIAVNVVRIKTGRMPWGMR
jgi:membrane protein implicated in regulation of membrane protease activity